VADCRDQDGKLVGVGDEVLYRGGIHVVKRIHPPPWPDDPCSLGFEDYLGPWLPLSTETKLNRTYAERWAYLRV